MLHPIFEAEVIARSVRRWVVEPRSVGPARHALRENMLVWGLAETADVAELVLSELFTNALRHATVPSDILIETHFEHLPDGIRIQVHDAGSAAPVPREVPDDAEGGRGLSLVDALTGGRWGVSSRDGAGKAVWAVIPSAAPSAGNG
ncbi:ATP-binding protein [Actinacidiphila yeochonensis]|uniref:ATP-binding protein n=1 Tax=Actinacidiphila yeochonensis TaxID=89050 RepID=UPI00099D8891|nr:ATP-binding protein [Actinacidiphila yeochonensis]